MHHRATAPVAVLADWMLISIAARVHQDRPGQQAFAECEECEIDLPLRFFYLILA